MNKSKNVCNDFEMRHCWWLSCLWHGKVPSFESISYPSFEKLFRYGGDNFWTQGPTMARFDYNGLCLSFYKKIKIGSLILAIVQQLKDSKLQV